MKNLKKLLALALALVMVFGLVACGGEQNATEPNNDDVQNVTEAKNDEPQTSGEPIVLEWYYRGNGVQKDTELVETAFNELLKTFPGMENVTVNFNCYTGADYTNAVALAQSAGQQIDILNTVGLDFVDQVKLGTYASLNDLLDANEALKNELPDWLWDLATVNGDIYMVPHYQRAANMEYMVIPTQYLAYGDEEAIRALCNNPDRTVEEIAEVLEEFCKAVQAAEGATKYMYPLGTSLTQQHGFRPRLDNVSGDFVVYENSDEIEYLFTNEDVVKAYEISARWYDEGLIRPDTLTAEESEVTYANMLNPVSYCFSFANGAGSEELISENLTKQYGFDVVAIPIWNAYFIGNTWAAGGDGVTAKCEHPTEALRLLELMNTEEGTELYNLIVYGIEGTHWEWTDDTHIKTYGYDGTQGGTDCDYGAMKWIMGNTFRAYLNQGCVDGENEIAMEINTSDDNIKSKIMGFRVDTTSLQTQLEQITAVRDEYNHALSHGAMGSAGWEALYNEFLQKLEVAGINDVLTELQAQIDTFLSK